MYKFKKANKIFEKRSNMKYITKLNKIYRDKKRRWTNMIYMEIRTIANLKVIHAIIREEWGEIIGVICDMISRPRN
jgi:hypothetical protein